MPLSGALASRFGWETIFYAFGGVGVLWFIAWSILIKGEYFIHDSISDEVKSTDETNKTTKECRNGTSSVSTYFK